MKIENYLEFFDDGGYEFYKCSGCFGPKLGHITQKCPKVEYDKENLQHFEIYLKEIGGFKEAIWKRDKEKEIERKKIRAKEKVEAAKAVESSIETSGFRGINKWKKEEQQVERVGATSGKRMSNK